MAEAIGAASNLCRRELRPPNRDFGLNFQPQRHKDDICCHDSYHTSDASHPDQDSCYLFNFEECSMKVLVFDVCRQWRTGKRTTVSSKCKHMKIPRRFGWPTSHSPIHIPLTPARQCWTPGPESRDQKLSICTKIYGIKCIIDGDISS